MKNAQDPQEIQANKPSNHKPLLYVLGSAVGVLVITVGLLLWQWQAAMVINTAAKKDNQQLQSKIDDLTKQLALAKTSAGTSSAPSAATPCNNTPSAALKENIKAALDTQNTAVFSTYTTNPVAFAIAASGKTGNETPDQAATDMDYTHSATGPWNFGLSAATIASYKAGFYGPTYFPASAYVGKAASGMVASFDFDCSGKIKQIFLAADASLLL